MISNTSKANDFIITVENSQSGEGLKDTVATEARGRMRCSNGKYHILYSETSPDDGSVASTIITAENDSVKIKRSGSVSSVMIYKEHLTHKFMYTLPFGAIPMTLYTDKLLTALSPEGGFISLKYRLDCGSGNEIINKMRISVKKEELL